MPGVLFVKCTCEYISIQLWKMILTSLYMQNVLRLLCPTLYISLTITKWYETSFNIYCFSNYCVPTSLWSLYHLFPCCESVYILYDILVRLFVNTISDILSDMACSIFQNISTYYILSIKYKVFCICYTDFQPLDPYHSPCRTLLSFFVLAFVHVYRQNIKHLLESTF